MNNITQLDSGKLILRLMVGILMLFHGYGKLVYGIGFIENLLIKNNIPTFVAYGIYIGEVLAPILLIIGYKTTIGAFIIILNMLMAIYLVHPNDLFTLSKYGVPSLELVYLYLFACLAIILLKAGKISIDGK